MQEKDKSTGKANKTQKKSWFQGLKSEIQQNRLDGQSYSRKA